MSKSGKVFIHQLSRLCNILAISLLQSKKSIAKEASTKRRSLSGLTGFLYYVESSYGSEKYAIGHISW